MSDLGFEFNETSAPKDDEGFTPVPEGDYNVTIESGKVFSRDENGADVQPGPDVYEVAVNLMLRINGPSHSNRVIYDWMTIKHGDRAREKSVKIGAGRLDQIRKVLGLKGIQNTDVLVGNQFTVSVSHYKNKDGETKESVRKYKALDGAPAPSATPAASGNVPPWQK